MKKIIAIFFIPLLCFFISQAVITGISSVQLSNARYFLLQNTQYGLSEEQFIKKMQNALDKVKRLDKINQTGLSNPQYYKLIANLNLWRASFSGSEKKLNFLQNVAVRQAHNIKQAQKYYRLALRGQPNNPFVWRRLAQTDVNYSNTEFSLVAITLAGYYAPSEKTILLDAILWKIPLWQQLYRKKKEETIKQIKYFAQSRESTLEARKQLNQLLKDNGLKTTVCNKLPRTQKFKLICN